MSYCEYEGTFVPGVGWVYWDVEKGIESGRVVASIHDRAPGVKYGCTHKRRLTPEELELRRLGKEAEMAAKEKKRIAKLEARVEEKKKTTTTTTTTKTTTTTTTTKTTSTSGPQPTKRANCESINAPDEIVVALTLPQCPLAADPWNSIWSCPAIGR
jgi:cell division protein FtsN